MRAVLVFVAGVVSATAVCIVATEVFIHLVEHTAYTKAAR